MKYQSYFLGKIKYYISKCCLLKFLPSMLSVNLAVFRQHISSTCLNIGSVQVSEWLVLPKADHEVLGLNLTGSGIQLRAAWCFILLS